MFVLLGGSLNEPPANLYTIKLKLAVKTMSFVYIIRTCSRLGSDSLTTKKSLSKALLSFLAYSYCPAPPSTYNSTV